MDLRPMSYDELIKQLDQAEEVIAAIIGDQADAVISTTGVRLLRLHETDQALRIAKDWLEQRLAERTRELEASNQALRQEIAERERAQMDLERLNAELERRVRERTAELQTTNHELEAFVYSVSHDLRAPLRGVNGWSRALVEEFRGDMDERALEYLNRIRSEGQRMAFLIEDLLRLSRISRVEIQAARVDLSKLAEAVTTRVREGHPNRQIEFCILPGMLTLSDAGLLEVVLTNLVDNAVKFTSREPMARIDLGQTRQNDQDVFYVRDNGIGFDMAHADRIFGPFQRLHNAHEFPGTGIGLATARRIVQRHGGSIWAESKPGDGATFYFTLDSA
jgi:light-regulated signal transduction histidine kinase (bacteriophytochrome)